MNLSISVPLWFGWESCGLHSTKKQREVARETDIVLQDSGYKVAMPNQNSLLKDEK